ncbi:murein biosynthesis integral membrane protein MurJ [Plantactinospora sp. GCM10030261]|uniref:murein biosynthesis integral membrane protein MurJ n=1 Tax=Plantactinospora sp. GCM10030261 TaxID=3273420 RepID=UPI00362116D3
MPGAGRIPAAGKIAGAAALIAALTVASRLAGFGRTAVFTWVLYSDLGGMYVVANTVPNIIFEIVAGGALASLVVPLLARAVAADDRRAVAATTAALVTWTVSLLVPLAVAVALLAEPIIGLLSDEASQSPDQIAAGARLLRIFAPQLPLYGIGIVLTGVLQAHRRFAWPVLAPLLSSVTVIGVYLAFAAMEGSGASVAEVSPGGEWLLAGGTTLGVVVLSLSLLIPLRRLGLRPWRPTYTFSAEARRKVGGLAVAGAVAVAGQQIALLVMLRLVNGGSTSDPVVFNLAQTMFLLPWAVLAVPLAVAAYPNLAAAAAERDERTYREVLAPTARRVLLFSCLGAAALVATAAPVARFFLGDATAAGPTGAGAAAIAGFAPGLLGYGLFAVLTRALYARGGTRSASLATAAGWLAVPLASVALSALAPVEYRVAAVAAGNSIGMLVLGVLLVVVVARAAGRPALRGLPRAAVVGLTAGTVAAVAGTVVAHALTGVPFDTPPRLAAFVQGMLSGVVVGAVFVAVAYPLDRRDLRPMLGTLRRRLGGAGARRAEGKETHSP